MGFLQGTHVLGDAHFTDEATVRIYLKIRLTYDIASEFQDRTKYFIISTNIAPFHCKIPPI